jgi:hypothetical protein
VPINAHGGGFLHHDGTYFWYGEHKVAGTAGNVAHVGVRVYSSTDLYLWKNEGVALAVDATGRTGLAPGCIIERPKVVFNPSTRRFVMWFHYEPAGEGYTGAQSGVAVSDSPYGPFRYIGSSRQNAKAWPANVAASERRALTAAQRRKLDELDLPGAPRPYYPKNVLYRRDFAKGQMARDMTLFVDDDGAGYHLYASEENGTLHLSQLAGDFLSGSGNYIRLFPGRFHEAPALMKRRGRYFLFTSDCTGWAPNAARVSVADSIWGPWEELGNPCVGSGADLATTFQSQSTYVLPVAGESDAFIIIGDRWCPDNAIDGRYVWLPIEFAHGVPLLRWHDRWDLTHFERVRKSASAR